MNKLKVLMAIDDPNFARIIVKTACSFFNKSNAEITLINIDETDPGEDFYYEKYPQKYIEHEAEKAYLAEIENFLESGGFSYKGFLYMEGDPANNILNVAAKESYDLIVTGTHNKLTFDRIFLGSVSYKISRLSKCSVLVIKPIELPGLDSNSPYNLLVAVDGSEYSEYASENIGKFIDYKRAQAYILNVTVPLEAVIPMEAFSYVDMARIMEESDLIAKDVLKNSAINLARQKFNVVKRYHSSGDPATVIVKELENNDYQLVMLGSHGKSELDLLMGSVSTKVYEHSPVPVLIVKK